MSFRTTIFAVFSLLFFGTPQITLGQWTSLNGPSGGRVGDIVSLDNALFVTTSPGGVFKSENQGTTWSPVNNGLPVNQNIGNLIEDNTVLYVTVTSRGIYKSEDNGWNWVQISNGIANTTFGALLVNGNQIYAGNANGGITFSSNGGQTWTFVEENIDGIQFQDFETFGDNVLAAGRPLFVSMDNGVGWESIEIPGLGLNGARALLAVGNTFFVADDGHVFRSEDDLETWTQLSLQTSATITNLIQFEDRIFATTSQGRYYFSDNNGDSWSLVSNTLTNDFVTSVFNDENQIIMSTGEGLFSSEDDGATWNVANDGLNAQIIEEVYVNENNVFAGSSDTGIFRLDRNSGNWLGINTGLDALNARTIHKILENDSGIFLATGGGVYFSSDNGDNWERRLDPGINSSIQVLETSNDIFLAGPGPNGLGLYISNDNGNIWDPIDIDILTVPTGYETMYFEGNDVIVGTASGEIYLSRDLADSWTNISINLPGFFFPQDIEVIDGIIYVATARGIVFSEDYGSTWNFFKNFFLSTTELEVNAGTFYATTSNGFYATNDSLDEWLPFNEGLDLRPQRSLFITDAELFLGTFGSSTWRRPISEIVLPDGPSPEDAFITTWKTDNPGGVDDRTITIPVSQQAIYGFNIAWGDGSSNENVSSAISHTYEEPGVYEVTISGRFPRIEFADQLQLIEVNQWGTMQWASMNAAFSGCENLDVLALDVPDLSAVFTTTGMFLSCTNLVGNTRFNDWDLENVVITASMFGGAISFNQDIGNWNTSNVQNMAGMFVLATSFNQDISNWDVSKVELMSAMFEQATSFNQDIGKWNVSNVTGMQGMFNKATAFDQDLGDWDLSAIEASGFRDLTDMFLDAGLSTENYDATLVGWANLEENETRIPQDINFDGGNSQFCFGEEARQNLIDTFGWTITDGGRSLDCIDPSLLFVTTWKTDNIGESDDNQIILPTFPGENYDYIVDWGDGTVENINSANPQTHTYNASGIFTVTIFGEFPRIFFNGFGDSEKLLSIQQWGAIQWTSMENAFFNCQNLDIVAQDVPDLSRVTSASRMLSGCSSLIGNENFENWDVSTITNMDSMFDGAEQFDQPIGSWQVSNVTSMVSTFQGASNFNQDIGMWDVSNVTTMDSMFEETFLFNQDIGNWDVSKVTNMRFMFESNRNFNQDISPWDVSNVENMRAMFEGTNFNQDITGWDVSNVTNMNGMFFSSGAFNQNIGSWDVSNVVDMQGMFFSVETFDQNLGEWDISSLQFADGMFNSTGISTENYDATLIGWANLDDGETRIPQDINFDGGSSQFCFGEEARQNLIDTFGWTITDGGRSLDCIDPSTAFITTWKTDNPGSSEDNQIIISTFQGETYNYVIDWGDGTIETITTATSPRHTYANPGVFTVSITGDFPRIFFNNGFDSQKLISLEHWGNIVWSSMESAFAGCSNLEIVAVDIPNLSNVDSMSSMFERCSVLLGNSSFENWDVSQVSSMKNMFNSAEKFNQNIGGWDVGNVMDMEAMFLEANTFNQNIGDWDVSKVISMRNMFLGASNFNKPLGSWDVSRVEDMLSMFVRATMFNQDIGSWDVGLVTNMATMFNEASSFNQDISNWDVSSVISMSSMFNEAFSFDQNLGDWDISSLVLANAMFLNTSLSTDNYDSLLNGWNTLDVGEAQVPSNINFSGGNSLFCFGEEARQNLIDTFGWTIFDGGRDSACPLNATLSVTAFNLIDADNDVVLQTISNGDQININDLPTTNLNIQAVSTDDVESVRLELTGPQNNGRTENIAPYALFGDSNGDYASNVFPLGDYGLIATPYSGNSLRGTVGTALEVSFSFVEEDPLCEGKSAEVISITDITQCDTFGGMVLIGLENFEANFSTIFGVVDRLSPNPETNVDYDGPSSLNNEPLEVFDITNLPGPGEYRAEIFDVDGCSVEVFFTLNGPDLPVVTLAPFDAVLDTDEPFVLTGGSPEGGIYSGEGVTGGVFDPSIGAGNYEITYTFTNPETNCTNSAMQVLTVNPSVTSNSVLAFVLVNADTNEDIGPITAGSVFDIASLPSNLNIRAETTDDVESVFMEISGGIVATRRENVAPYALFGDRNGDYFGSSFPAGSFTVSATPYTGNNLRGEMGSTLSVAFSINGSQAAQNPIALSIYPNPTTSSVMASFEEAVTVERIQVFDVQGRLIRTYDAKHVKDGEGYRLDVNDMPAGSYFIRTQDTKGFNYQKQLVIER